MKLRLPSTLTPIDYEISFKRGKKKIYASTADHVFASEANGMFNWSRFESGKKNWNFFAIKKR